MGLIATIAASIRGTYTSSNDLSAVSQKFGDAINAVITLESGTGSGQADKIFMDDRTLAASATENLDLAGSLTDAFGATITFATVKAILVIAKAANTNDVVIGGAASNGFVGPFGGTTPTVSVKPGGLALMVAPKTGWTVTASTGDILKMANSSSGTGVDYSIVIIGTSA